jgi:hypothetical protein
MYFCVSGVSYLLLLLIAKNSLLIHEKTSGPIATKFSYIIMEVVLCNQFVSECRNIIRKYNFRLIVRALLSPLVAADNRSIAF